MAKLTSTARSKIPAKDFALPERRYPIEDKAHARNALARVSQHGSTQEKKTVKQKVHEKFPEIHQAHQGHSPHTAKGHKDFDGTHEPMPVSHRHEKVRHPERHEEKLEYGHEE